MDQRGFDSFFLPVTKSNTLSATLTGKGTCDLDLYLKDIDDLGNYWQTAGDTKKYPDYARLMQSISPTRPGANRGHRSLVRNCPASCAERERPE